MGSEWKVMAGVSLTAQLHFFFSFFAPSKYWCCVTFCEHYFFNGVVPVLLIEEPKLDEATRGTGSSFLLAAGVSQPRTYQFLTEPFEPSCCM